MKQLFFCINFTFFTLPIFAQINETIINFTFDTATFKYPLYEIKETSYEDYILRAIITETATNKQIAEFLRINNNTYYYIQKNDSNKIIAEGKAVLEKKPYQKIKIPQFNTKGELVKYKTYNYFALRKEGMWFENPTDSTSRCGKYSNSLKDSIWAYAKAISPKINVLEKEIQYRNDKIISAKNLDIFIKPIQEIEKELIGTWIAYNFYNSVDSIIPFQKIKGEKEGLIKLIFNKNKEIKLIAKTRHQSPKRIYNWVIENNQINIYSEGKCLFTITHFNKDYFVLIYN